MFIVWSIHVYIAPLCLSICIALSRRQVGRARPTVWPFISPPTITTGISGEHDSKSEYNSPALLIRHRGVENGNSTYISPHASPVRDRPAFEAAAMVSQFEPQRVEQSI